MVKANMNTLAGLLLTVISLFFSFFCLSQSPASQAGIAPITNYGPNTYDGTGQVWTAVQDTQGVIFIGTTSEIAVYDGVRWRKVRRPAYTVTRALLFDSTGQLFYGSYADFGLVKKDSAGNYYTYSLLHYLPDSVREFAEVWSIHSSGRHVYFQTRQRIIRLTRNEGNSEPQWSARSWTPETRFMLAFLPGRDYYVHQMNRGLYRMRGDSLVFVPGSEFLGDERVGTMIRYWPPGQTGKTQKNPLFLIGMFYRGLFVFDGKSFTRFRTEIDSVFSVATIYKGIRLPDNTYMFSTKGEGIRVLDASGKLLQQITDREGLQDLTVHNFFLDRSGSLWLSLNSGLSRVDISAPHTVYNKLLGLRSKPQSVAAFDGYIYAGTATGMYVLNKQKNEFEEMPGCAPAIVWEMQERDGQLYFVSDGLFRIKNNKVHTILRSTSGEMQFTGLLFPKHNNDLLFCANSFGIVLFKKGKQIREGGSAYNEWNYLGQTSSINAPIYAMAEAADGTIWASDGSSSIYRITAVAPQTPINSANELKIETIKDVGIRMPFKANNEVFFAADSTFMRVDGSNSRLFNDTTIFKDVLDREQAGLGAYEDAYGNLFCMFGRRPCILWKQKDGSYTADSTSLIFLADKNIVDAFTDNEGITWISTMFDIVRYDHRGQRSTEPSFRALLTSVQTRFEFLDPDLNHNRASPLTLTFSQNSLRFDYAAPYFDQETKTKYQTWLEGFEKSWTELASNTYKEYTNLAPGEYVFHVRAQNLHGRISEEAIYRFIVLAPWYQRWWAYALYAAMAAGLVWLFARYRSRSLKKANSILEHKVAVRTAELNHSLQELKATQSQLIQSEKMASLGELTAGIAHEIQNPLNFVNNFAEISVELVDEMKTELDSGNNEMAIAISNDLSDNLKKIDYHGKRADAIVKGMLQHSRNNSGQKEMVDINALADEYLRLSYHGFRARDKSFNANFELDADPNAGKIVVVPQSLGRVILNLLTNAFYAVNEKRKNATGHYEPMVRVSTERIRMVNGDGVVQITVSDNGNGIPKRILDKIFQPFFSTKPTGQGTGLGLSLSYDIVTNEHGGKLKVTTKEGEGTDFTIVLPVQTMGYDKDPDR